MSNYSDNPNGNQGARVRDFARPQPTPHDFKEDENAVEQANATVNRYTHPIEDLFARPTARHGLGRGIPKNSPLLGIQGE